MTNFSNSKALQYGGQCWTINSLYVNLFAIKTPDIRGTNSLYAYSGCKEHIFNVPMGSL
jgi:hypothetical protein